MSDCDCGNPFCGVPHITDEPDSSLQELVYQKVTERGYGYFAYRDKPRTPFQSYLMLQLTKSLEEFGEVARDVFDGRVPSLDEIADVIIPLMMMVETAELGDLDEAIRAKVTKDVKRGVRNNG